MENRRFILLALLGVVFFFIYQAWQSEQAPKNETPPTAVTEPAAGSAPAVTATGDAPALNTDPVTAAVTPAGPSVVTVRTDKYIAEISSQGGELRRVQLVGYPLSKKKPDENIALLNDRDGHHFVLQAGLAGTPNALTSSTVHYTAAQPEYVLAPGQDTLEVPLDYTDASGYTVRKLYRFHRGSYEVDLEQQLNNATAAPLTASAFVRLVSTAVETGPKTKFIQTFMGLGWYQAKPNADGYKFSKVAFDKLNDKPFDAEQKGGWIAILQHYFLAAILPAQEETHHFSGKPAKDGAYQAQYLGPAITVAPQAQQNFVTRLFIGPKLQDSIGAAAPGLEYTVDYGVLAAISEILFKFMAFIHQYTGNWGWSIVLLTLCVKLAFFKLSEAQYRSMAKMRKFGPRIQELKERYADDRERMSKAMMELYKKEGFNPLAGCWPLLVQMPVFFALYWVLVESVELRQADFILWINDLTSPDPFFVLPVLYGISMWATQKLSGQAATMDPMQARMMSIMPIALAGFFTFFPAGLVLYWLVSNLIGIAQQWYITQKLDKEGLGKPKAA